jgi:cyanate permease
VIAAEAAGQDAPNHPKAIGMGLIASLTFNIGVGSVMGSPGVLLPRMTERLGVSIEAASAGMLAIMVASSLFAPKIGSLAIKRSLRGILAGASIMLSAAWLLLFLTRSYLVFMIVNALLFGPVMAVTGSVLAPTVITRWFNRHRGLAIGLCHLPIMVAIIPIATEWCIQRFGLSTTFLILAALPLVTILPASLWLIDWPPELERPVATAHGTVISHGPVQSMGEILRQPRFWALTLAVGMPNTSSILLGLHLVSMAKSWGIEPLAAAGLASIMSLVGMAGSVALGILADRIGGARTLALMTVCDAALWLTLLSHPHYLGLAVIIGMIGFFGAGAVPAISKAYGEAFSRATFSRAIGLMAPVTLPLMALGLILPGTAVRLTGSYAPVIVAMAVAFLLAAVLALGVARSSAQRGGTPVIGDPELQL